MDLQKFRELAGVSSRFPSLTESVNSMNAGNWYKQTFRGGEEIYFKALAQQQNGGWKGMIIRYGLNGKPQKAQQTSVREFRLWNLVPERDVPSDVLDKI